MPPSGPQQHPDLVPGTSQAYATAQPSESVIIPGRGRVPGRILVVAAAVLWAIFLVVVITVLVAWHTPPMHAVPVGRA